MSYKIQLIDAEGEVVYQRPLPGGRDHAMSQYAVARGWLGGTTHRYKVVLLSPEGEELYAYDQRKWGVSEVRGDEVGQLPGYFNTREEAEAAAQMLRENRGHIEQLEGYGYEVSPYVA